MIYKLYSSCALLFLATSIISCTSKTVNNPIYPADSGEFTYTVDGIKDTTLERIGTVSLPIIVKKLTGASEKVTFSQFDMPVGMEIRMEKTIDEPSFNTFIYINTTRTKVGTYPIKITGASPTTGITEYKMQVTVTPYTNEARGLKGDFVEKGNCSVVGHDVNVVISSNANNRIVIRGLWQGTMTNEIYANLTASNNTLTIPSQTLFGLVYEGTGTYTDDGMVISYTVKGVNISHTCSSTFTRK